MSRITKIQLRRDLLKAMFTLALIFTTTALVQAQGPGDPGDINPDNGVPLDGGVILLIAGGITYVAVKIRKQQLKRKTVENAVEK